jgi:2-polyprenyl-6-methoxyphenol hydroxylase-like FAD-dependent oxidoreductase
LLRSSLPPERADAFIVGAGPAGLAAALALAGRARVRVITPTLPAPTDPPRVDVVPASFLALLVELGVHPAQLGVTTLHSVRRLAWGTAEPETVEGRAVAHIERPALELALLAALERTAAARIIPGTPASVDACEGRAIDATGRRALSATRLIQPPDPFVARAFSWRGHFGSAQQVFAMAALPVGYVYRLATDRLMTVGVILCRSAASMSTAEIARYIQTYGAEWVLEATAGLEAAEPGRGGIASVQWRVGKDHQLPVGDAALARDSLSAQGLAAGVADATSLVRDAEASANWRRRRDDQLHRHLHHLSAAIEHSRFRHAPTWAGYLGFLTQHRYVTDLDEHAN